MELRARAFPVKFEKFRLLQSSQAKEVLFALSVALFVFTWQFALLSYGFHFEEGREVTFLRAMQAGMLPYRDFEWIYGPVSLYFYKALIGTAPFTLMTVRLIYALLLGLSVPVAYALSRRFLSPFYSALGAFLLTCLFQIPFYTYNHVFFAIFSMLSVTCFCVRERRPVDLVFGGLFAALSFLSKPLPSGALFLAAIFLWSIIHVRPFLRLMIYFICSFVVVLLGYFYHLLSASVFRGVPVQYPYLFSGTAFIREEQADRLSIATLWDVIVHRLLNATLIKPLLSSGTSFRLAVLDQYSDFILLSLTLIPLVYVLFRSRLLVSDERRTKMDLIALAGFLVSLETIVMPHGMNRAYTSQFSFLLLLTLLASNKWKPRTNLILSLLLTCYISSVGFFYFGFGKMKKFTTLVRRNPAMAAVRLVEKDAKFVEELFSYHSKEKKLAVIGYFPNITMWMGVSNIFENDETRFQNFYRFLGDPSQLVEPARLDRFSSRVQYVLDMIRTKEPDYVVSFSRDTRHHEILAHFPELRKGIENFYSVERIFKDVDPYASGNYSMDLTVWKRR